MLTINTNTASLNAQRNLSGSQSALATSLQRLSSGMRINSAKDDAAGLAIASRMSSQISGLDVARRNANDGISLAQTAEGGMTSATDMLQRMRALAVQSANDTNSATDRKAIQAEVSQLKEELNRLVDTTQFNGKNVLDGTMNNAQFQVGANANQTINVSIGNVRGTAIGNYGSSSAMMATSTTLGASRLGSTNNVAGNANLMVAGNGVAKTVNIAQHASAQDMAKAVNGVAGSTGVNASASNKVTLTNIASTSGTVNFKLTGDNNTTVDISATLGSGADANKGLAEAINAQTSTTGISAKVLDNGALEMSNNNGADIKISALSGLGSTMNVAGNNGKTVAMTTAAAATSATIVGTVKFDSNKAFNISGGTASDIGTDAISGTLSAVDEINVTTAQGSTDALKILDAALATMNSQKADLGALQNRFSNTINNLQSSSENLNAARGRIEDTDFASETAKMSRNQVLQQAGTAMLAQANQLPQQVLQLLR